VTEEKNELIALFDIGSASVSGALVLMPSEGGKPTFLASHYFPILFEKDLEPAQFEKRMFQALKEVGQKIAVAKPRQAYCFLASPWSAHQTRIINFKTETPLVSRQEIKKLVNQELSKFHADYKKKFPKSQIIESKIQSLLARKKESPLEKTLALFLSVSQENIVEEAEEIIKKTLKVPNVYFNSFLLAQFVVVRNFFNVSNFILVDVGGEVTEVAKASEEILTESLSFPAGKNTLKRLLADVFGINAETLLSLYLADRLDETSRQSVEKLLAIEKKHWQEHFAAALRDLRAANEPIFLTADNDIAPWFTEAISTLTKEPIRCIFLEAKSLTPFCKFSHDVKPDPFLIIEVLSLQAHEI